MPRLKRKVTAKRLAANRSAALRSTGPRIAAGKQRSSLNALLGFGLALADTDSKELLGFGESNADLASHLFYAGCDQSPLVRI